MVSFNLADLWDFARRTVWLVAVFAFSSGVFTLFLRPVILRAVPEKRRAARSRSRRLWLAIKRAFIAAIIITVAMRRFFPVPYVSSAFGELDVQCCVFLLAGAYPPLCASWLSRTTRGALSGLSVASIRRWLRGDPPGPSTQDENNI